MSRKQWLQGRGYEGRGYEFRGRERPRWGAKRQAATCVAEEKGIQDAFSYPAQAGCWRPRPPARAFTPSKLIPAALMPATFMPSALTPSALTPLIILGLLGLFVLALSGPGFAQTSTLPVTVSGPPDVLVIVYQQPGGADQVDITYARTLPHAQAARDYQALTQAARWPVGTHRIQDVAAPMQSHSGPMTSVVFQALGVVQDATHTFPVQTFAQAFHTYKRINVVFFVGPQFQFQGPRSYADTDIRMTLDQHGAAYVYALEILNPQMATLPPLGTAPLPTGRQSPGLLLLVIFGVAALAGLAVYLLTARLTAKAPARESGKDTDSRVKVGTK